MEIEGQNTASGKQHESADHDENVSAVNAVKDRNDRLGRKREITRFGRREEEHLWNRPTDGEVQSGESRNKYRHINKDYSKPWWLGCAKINCDPSKHRSTALLPSLISLNTASFDYEMTSVLVFGQECPTL